MDPWSCPFQGLSYFLTTPRVWGWGLLAAFSSSFLACLAVAGTIYAAYPSHFAFWGALKAIGWGLFALTLLFAALFPMIFNFCFAKALSKHGAATFSLYPITWKLLWPILLLVSLLFVPVIVFPLSLFALNHLAVLEGADLALSLLGVSSKERVEWIEKHGTDCFQAALSGSLLLFLLSLILVGWIIWVPAMYCGVFLWVRKEISYG